MKIFQKKWVKVLLLLAFCGTFPASVYLDAATLWAKEVKLFEQEEVPYRESVIYKENVVCCDVYAVETLCEEEESLQALLNKTIHMTDYGFGENGEDLILKEETDISWQQFLQDQGMESIELIQDEDEATGEAVVSEWQKLSDSDKFICMSGADFVQLLEQCPYEKLYDASRAGEMTEEDMERYDTDNQQDAYELYVEERMDGFLINCADFDWDEWNSYDADKAAIRIYEEGDNFILYNEKKGIIIGNRIKKTKLSKIRESATVYLPDKSSKQTLDAEDWIAAFTSGITTSLVQQLSYELYQSIGVGDDHFDTALMAADIYKDGSPFLHFGEVGEENSRISFTKNEIGYICGKDSSLYQGNYEFDLYYSESWIDTTEQKFLEFLYEDCLEHGERSGEAVVFTIISLILGILLLVSFLPPLWRREEKKLRDRPLIELNILFTIGVVAACVGGIYGVCVLLYEVLIPLFPVGGAIVGGAIAIGLLVLLGLYAVYQLISTVIYRLRNHCFVKSWLIGRFCLWIIGKIKALLKNFDILKRRILCLAVIWICSFIAMVIICYFASYYEGFVGVFGMFCYFVFMIGFSYAFLKDAMDNKRLLDGCNRMKDGDFAEKISTDRLYFDKLALAEAINTMGEGLEKAVQTSMKDERTKTELITNVSHDIKTPLTSIINYVDLLKREGATPEEKEEYLRVLDAKSQRLKQLIEDLVEVSKTNTGNIELQLSQLDFKELLNQALGEFQEKFAGRNLELVVTCAEHKIQIWADGRRCYRILENLLQNVYKYAMPNTRVYVDLQQEGSQMVFTMKNISEAPLNIPVEELMERFVRGDVSRSTSGSGLGLSITENLVHLQQGKLEVKLDGDLFKVEIRFPIWTGTE